MEVDEGDIVYRKDISDPAVFDARFDNLILYPADRPKGYKDKDLKRPRKVD